LSRDNRNWGLQVEGRLRLGANVMVRRLRADISRSELAASAAITPQRLGQIENGTSVATLDVWVRLAGTLGVSLDELLAGVRWVPVPPEEKPGEGAYLVKRKAS
jgi:transcriptional regulator with XRE-family HTH domain